MKVSELYIHPIKSGRGVSVPSARLARRGLVHDRRWLICDDEGLFLTQRTWPALARLLAEPISTGLRLSFDGAAQEGKVKPSITVDLNAAVTAAKRRPVTVWRDTVDALCVDEETNAWLSQMLGRNAALYFLDDAATRTTNQKWGAPSPVSFADAFPVLITTTASLDALNAVIRENGGDAVPMTRFRPNIVIDGADAWGEDHWKTIRIGDARIELMKPCDRCQVTTLDPLTGGSLGKEPLASLARFRRSAHPDVGGVVFGVNSATAIEGDIKIGDDVEVEAWREAPWPIEPAKEAP